MDKELNKILKRAKADQPVIEKPKPEKIFPKNGPYDYLVFTKLVGFASFPKLIFVFLFPGIISIGFFFEGLRIWSVYGLIGYAALFVLVYILNLYRYNFRFKGWQERLPFQLNGWNEMIHEKKMFCDLCWNQTRIEVHLKDDSTQIKELVAASLTLFAKQSKRAFYDRDLFKQSKLSRNEWKLISQTVAEGSASPKVMRYMKNLFEQELSIIATKTGKIKSVQVTMLSEEFEVAIYINSGD